MAFLTLLSRITGYFRDNLLAQILGASEASDAYLIAFRIPNLLRRLVGEGTMTAAFVPTLSDYTHGEKRRELWEFVALAFTTLAVVLAIITALGILFSPLLVKVLASGFTGSGSKWDLTVALNRFMFPYIFFIGLAALAMATLNTLGVFALPSSTPIVLNLSVMGIAWFFARTSSRPAYVFAAGVLVGGALQVGMLLPALWVRGWRPVPRFSFTHPGIRQVGRLMLPGLFGLGISQIILIVDSRFASFLGDGPVSALYYAGRVNELALGSFAISVSTVILPALSRRAAAGEIEELRTTLLFGLRLVAFVTVPAMAGLIVLRREIVAVLFEHGAFDAAATAMTSTALLYYAMGLFAFGGIKVVAPAFFARKDTRTPVKLATLTLMTHITLCTILSSRMGLGGIALSDSITGTMDLTLLILAFRHQVGLPLLRPFIVPVLIFGAASAAMASACLPALRVLSPLCAHLPQGRAIALVATLALAVVLYFVLCLLLRRKEPAIILATMNPMKRRRLDPEILP
jgi:putative peptidoglycan lipid II flippase